MHLARLFPHLLLLLSAAPGCNGNKTDTGEGLMCEVAIIGGGAGGLYTAFRLAPTLGENVCLFEKEAELGGRIHDVSLDDDPDEPRVGAGARRIMEGQDVVFDLATELNLYLETPDLTADLISARGGFAFSKEDLLPLYPGVEPDESGDTETAMYDALRYGDEREDAEDYADLRAYIQSTLGPESYDYLLDMSRFRADFEYPLDAAGYLDYLDEEWDVCCQASYPVGGMSEFIRAMQASAEENGARIFLSEPVSSFNRNGGSFTLNTSAQSVAATKVIVAVPPAAFDYIEGDVADDIRAQQVYQDIIGVKVVTITNWWSEPWYAEVINPALTEDNNVWRAWTTEHCLNFIEIPQEAYAADANITRSVYNDDADCSEFWETLALQGDDAVNEEVKRGLTYLFNANGVSSPEEVEVPDPIGTHVQVWPAAWHWLRAGASVTNQELFEWAADPLDGENVGMVGEAYNVQRSGWSDGAYKSAINLLNEHYGMDL